MTTNNPEDLETPIEEAALETPEVVVPEAVRDAPEPVSIFSAGSEMEAQIVRGILEDAGVPVYGQETGVASYGYALALGEARYADIYVAPEDAARAQAVIAAAQEGAAAAETPVSSSPE